MQILIIIFIFGIIFGSFGNVLILRLPRNLSIIKPGSFCPLCNKSLKIIDNIPVLSYLLLRGKCRYCKNRINPRYILFELLIGILFSFLFLYYNLSLEFYLISVFSFIVFVIMFIDIEHKIIPNELSIFLIIYGLSVSFFNPFIESNSVFIKFLMSFLGMISAGLIMYLLSIIGEKIFKKEAIGGGDIKMYSGICSFFGISSIFYVLFYASIIGSILGILLILFKRSKDKIIAFGPCLGIASLLWIYLY